MKKAVLFDMDGILYDSEGFYMDITVSVMRELGYTGPVGPIMDVVGTTAADHGCGRHNSRRHLADPV